MKKLFFFLIVANLLVFLAAGIYAPPLPEGPTMRSAGNIRFLNPGELEAYRGGDEAGSGASGSFPASQIAGEEFDEEAFRAELERTLDLDEGHCLSLGPMATQSDANGLSNELADQGIAGAVRTEIGNEVQSFLVVVPTESSAEAADIVKKLREAGHKDVWWLTTGDRKDEVSVGIFRNKGNAEVRRRQMEESGFDTEIVPREIERRAYWIDLRESASRSMTVEVIEKLRKRFDRLTAEQRRCVRSPL